MCAHKGHNRSILHLITTLCTYIYFNKRWRRRGSNNTKEILAGRRHFKQQKRYIYLPYIYNTYMTVHTIINFK
jgi:hypothetical protein